LHDQYRPLTLVIQYAKAGAVLYRGDNKPLTM
jgi:hypothetical protein